MGIPTTTSLITPAKKIDKYPNRFKFFKVQKKIKI
jgi:hypothetical protein